MRTLVTCCAAALVATCAPAGLAEPAVDGPPGRRCSYAGPGWDGEATAVVSGGPLAGHGTLVCTLVRNGNRHNSPDVAWQVEQPSVEGVAVLPPQVVEWQFAEDVLEYLCTSWRYPDGTTIYWGNHVRADWPWDDQPGYWTTDPTAWCTSPPGDWSVKPLLPELLDEVDERACPALRARQSGPFDPSHPYRVYVDDDGDVYADDDGDGLIQADEWWWDCPPYQGDDPAADPLQ